MRIFVLELSYLRPLAEVDAHLDAHREWLAGNVADGWFLLAGRQQPPTGGIIVARGRSSEQVQDLIESDPFEVHGVASYRVIEVMPAPAPFSSATVEAFLAAPLGR